MKSVDYIFFQKHDCQRALWWKYIMAIDFGAPSTKSTSSSRLVDKHETVIERFGGSLSCHERAHWQPTGRKKKMNSFKPKNPFESKRVVMIGYIQYIRFKVGYIYRYGATYVCTAGQHDVHNEWQSVRSATGSLLLIFIGDKFLGSLSTTRVL